MENRKTKIISVVSIIALALTLVTATYAYFAAQTGEGAQTDIKINASTVDTLTFETGSAISLSLDQDNFASGKGNQSGTTFAKAILTANNKTNTATEDYYMYLNISDNTFTYTQDEETPEILLTITDTNNNEITSINGLTYKTVTDGNGTTVKGFDITNQKGLITILDNREITTTSSITEEWNVTITYVNYNADQSANAGKIFSANLIIQQKKLPSILSDICNAGDNLANCITTLSSKSIPNATKIYYHDSSLANGAGDNSYRYAGPTEQINNFVCFGSTTNPCPTDNLYRIIGVIEDKVKLIKYDYANSNLLGTDGDYNQWGSLTPNVNLYKGTLTSVNRYYWNYKATSKGTNTWSASLLNKTNLNTNFINNIGEEWSNRIAMTTWKIGGNTRAKVGNVNPSVAYQNEITSPDATNSTDNATEYEAKVGLMYVSDYGFAANPESWTTSMNDYYDATDNNWMYMGFEELTITRMSNGSTNVFYVNIGGCMLDNYVGNDRGVRPVFNLESSVTYVSGSGTQSDPIRIN